MILRPRTPKSFIVEISACRWFGFGGMRTKFDSNLPLGSGRNEKHGIYGTIYLSDTRRIMLHMLFLNQIKGEAFRIHNFNESKTYHSAKGLDSVIKCGLAAFDALRQGPLILRVKALKELVKKIEVEYRR